MRMMKYLFRLTIAALMLCLMMNAAFAADTAGFSISLNGNGDGYVVTGYTGSESSVTVPDWYAGKPVTMIGAGAFQGNAAIKSVSLPSTITRIGAAAFKNCTALSTLTTYTATVRVAGDADGNGAVDFQDAMLVLQYGAGENVSINTLNADVNGDGKADIQDALILIQREAGWDVKLQ